MLHLDIIPPAFGLDNPALFSLKAEVLLRMSGLGYQAAGARPDKAPKGKLPVLRDEARDAVVPDSAHIKAYLEQEYGIDFDGHLSAAERAEAMAWRGMVEDHLYFVILHALFVDQADTYRDEAFGEIPNPFRKLVFRSIQKRVKARLVGQGLGLHSQEQIYAFGVADLEALETKLSGSEAYFFGARASSIDATVYGALRGILHLPLDTPIARFARQSQVLSAYVERMRAAFFPERAAHTEKSASEPAVTAQRVGNTVAA